MKIVQASTNWSPTCMGVGEPAAPTEAALPVSDSEMVASLLHD
jgi:hypothetical protein